MFEFHRWKISGISCLLKTFWNGALVNSTVLSDEKGNQLKPIAGNKKELAVRAPVAFEAKAPVMDYLSDFLSDLRETKTVSKVDAYV